MKKIQLHIIIGIISLMTFSASAQTPNDALMMGKGQICIALPYAQESWTNYWEADLKRSNANLGKVSTKAIMPQFALGLFDNLNILGGVNYISTAASQGTLRGHSGLQDVSILLKYKPLSIKLNEHELAGFIVAGFSTPISNYYPDYMPLAIGAGTTNGSIRGILNFKTKSGIYATLNSGYTSRSNITLDRSYYYTNTEGGITSNDMKMPNLFDGGAALGFTNSRTKIEMTATMLNTIGGTDIRRNDMPLPSVGMDNMRVGIFAQYFPEILRGGGVMAFSNYTLSGRNIGQATTIGGGITYRFDAWKKAE